MLLPTSESSRGDVLIGVDYTQGGVKHRRRVQCFSSLFNNFIFMVRELFSLNGVLFSTEHWDTRIARRVRADWVVGMRNWGLSFFIKYVLDSNLTWFISPISFSSSPPSFFLSSPLLYHTSHAKIILDPLWKAQNYFSQSPHPKPSNWETKWIDLSLFRQSSNHHLTSTNATPARDYSKRCELCSTITHYALFPGNSSQ